jgi:hypothetical protein
MSLFPTSSEIQTQIRFFSLLEPLGEREEMADPLRQSQIRKS